jgi:hypothetical protein
MALDLTKLRDYPTTEQVSYALRESATRFRNGTFFNSPAEAAKLGDNIGGAILSITLGDPKPLVGAGEPHATLTEETFAQGLEQLAAFHEADCEFQDACRAKAARDAEPPKAKKKGDHAGEGGTAGQAEAEAPLPTAPERPKGPFLNAMLLFFMNQVLPLIIDRLRN